MPSTGTRASILLVTDSPAMSEALSGILADGFQLTKLPSVGELVATLKHGLPELLLLATELQDEATFDLCRQITSSADTCRLPVVMIGKPDAVDEMPKALEAGAVDFITTPLAPQDVLTRVKARVSSSMHQTATQPTQVRLQTLFDLAPDSVIIHDAEGRIIDFNPQTCLNLGYTREELLKCRIFDIEVGVEEEKIRDIWRRVINGEKLIAEGLQRRKDGSTYPVEVSLGVFIEDSHKYILVIGRDVSKRETAEAERQESEERFKAVFNKSFQFSVILDKNGNMLDMNEMCTIVCGELVRESQGKPLWDAIWWRDLPDVRKKTQAAIAAVQRGETVTDEVCFYDKDRVLHDGIRIFSPIQNDKGELTYIATAGLDITERKRMEQELRKMQKLESVGFLAGGIAHDFNNLLTGVYMSISLAKMKLTQTHPAVANLEQAERSIDRATSLTGRLLTFSHGGSPIKEEVELGELVKETVSSSLNNGAVVPIFHLDGDTWTVEVDKAQIARAISNVVTNACEAMPEGGRLYTALQDIELDVDDSPDPNQGNYVRLSIRDEGIGIPSEDLQKVFDPYFSTKQIGNGLGLAEVYSIVRKHGGSVDITSELGKGTEVTFFIPAVAVTAETGNRDNAKARAPRPIRILLMDDEELILETTAEILAEYGYTSDTARNGREAVKKYSEALARNRPYSLVILDLTIPGGMGGKDTLQKLQQIDPEVKAIVASGYARDPIIANHADYGFKGVLTKPFLPDNLLKVLGSLTGEG